MRRVLTSVPIGAIINIVVGVADVSHGGVAQLVERLNGIQEVRGSTPLISTNSASVCYAFCKSMPIVNEWVFGKTGNKPTFW